MVRVGHPSPKHPIARFAGGHHDRDHKQRHDHDALTVVSAQMRHRGVSSVGCVVCQVSMASLSSFRTSGWIRGSCHTQQIVHLPDSRRMKCQFLGHLFQMKGWNGPG